MRRYARCDSWLTRIIRHTALILSLRLSDANVASEYLDEILPGAFVILGSAIAAVEAMIVIIIQLHSVRLISDENLLQ